MKESLKCLECGSTMQTVTATEHYRAGGLPHVMLVGVPVSTCPGCGDREVKIHAIEELHRAIARALALKPAKLMPGEIRFLRKHLGYTSRDLASHLGVSLESVSRWENDRTRIALPTERLLRMLVARKEPVEAYERELPQMGVSKRAPIRLGLKRAKDGWSPARVA